MIVYTYDQGRYVPVEDSLAQHPEGQRAVYINMTNYCNCACTFCLRSMKNMREDATLWLKQEATLEEIFHLLDALPWHAVNEIVVCGFGEPTGRLADVIAVLRYVKTHWPHIKTRLNTNGLSDLLYERDTSVDFQGGILDTISISLNASNAERYLELTRSQYGIQSYEAMLNFAVHCKQYVPNVVMTVVEKVENEAEIAVCRDICAERGLTLRVRTYEDH